MMPALPYISVRLLGRELAALYSDRAAVFQTLAETNRKTLREAEEKAKAWTEQTKALEGMRAKVPGGPMPVGPLAHLPLGYGPGDNPFERTAKQCKWALEETERSIEYFRFMAGRLDKEEEYDVAEPVLQSLIGPVSGMHFTVGMIG